ncbi:NRDE protein-domain-containing protein [Russula aff. rugulosa BPL654]|nr:NRDE protein-domain-containing protein [Russula aff. rugulosa BPL654]
MCVGFWSLTHPDYALILCANRDEYLARPTLPTHFHSFEALTTPAAPSNDTVPAVLSGRDVRAEGTWLGISQSTGRVALLTNISEPGASYASSRGTLVAAFLADPRGHSDLASATTALTAEDTSYAGFNLLLLEPHSHLPTTGSDTVTTTLAYDARLLTNDGGGGHIRARTLSDDECACGGISNGVDGQGGDVWPKVLQGRAALRSILDEGSADGPKIADADSHLVERLMELLTTRSPFPSPRERGEPKNTIIVPPLSRSDAPLDLYGTRLAQVLLVHRDGRVTYAERDIWTLDGTGAAVRASPENTRSFIFRLGSDS